MKVEAIQLGYYGLLRRRVGEVFEIASDKDFSAKWMQRVDGKAPTKKASAAHDEDGQEKKKAGKTAGRSVI